MGYRYRRPAVLRSVDPIEYYTGGYIIGGRLGIIVPISADSIFVRRRYRTFLLAKEKALSLKSKVFGWFIRREINNQVKEGTVFGQIWTWLNGKKTLFGAVLVVLGTVAEQLQVILPAFVGPAEVAQYSGVALAIVGGLHKIYKYLYERA